MQKLPEIHDSPVTTQLVSLVMLYLNLVAVTAVILQLQFTFSGSEGWGRVGFAFENYGGTGVSHLSLRLGGVSGVCPECSRPRECVRQSVFISTLSTGSGLLPSCSEALGQGC